jgi:hypothetical protein
VEKEVAGEGPGRKCPGRVYSLGGNAAGEEVCTGSDGGPCAEVAAEQRAAIERFLAAPGALAGRAGWVRRAVVAALRFAGALLLSAGVLAGYADGDDLDEVGCTVAHQPDGDSHGGHSAQARQGGGGKVPGHGDGSGGGSDGGDPAGRPECEARAKVCPHRMADGQCQITRRQCRLFAGAVEMRDMAAWIHRGLAAVARGDFELRKENEELRTLQGEGYFKFALRVEPDDFRVFAIIMALGNRKAAADFLDVPHRSFYDRVDKWSERGKDYRRLYRFVEWRKKVGRKIVVPLGDSMQSGEPSDEPENPQTVEAVADRIATADSRDYPTILREILEALARQNPKNWAEVRREVAELIREEVG